jgi:hypothetical protein
MQALIIQGVGSSGERELFLLAARMFAHAALLVQTEPDTAAAIILQLLPPLAR